MAEGNRVAVGYIARGSWLVVICNDFDETFGSD